MIDPSIGQLLDQAGYFREFTKNGIRTDGRGFSDHRHIAVGSDDSRTSSTYGSSSVHIGKTKVSCSISVLIGTPSQQHPESGDVGIILSRYSSSLIAHTFSLLSDCIELQHWPSTALQFRFWRQLMATLQYKIRSKEQTRWSIPTRAAAKRSYHEVCMITLFSHISLLVWKDAAMCVIVFIHLRPDV